MINEIKNWRKFWKIINFKYSEFVSLTFR